MNVKTRRLKTGLLIGSEAAVALVAIVASLLYALLRFGIVPLNEGEQLADGAITPVITDWMGPIAIGAYIFELGDGNVGLVDAGMDPNATAVLEALRRMGRTADDVWAILFTHEHNDHMSGARACG